MFSAEHPPEVLAPFPGLVPPPLLDGTPIWRRLLEMKTATLGTAYGDDLPVYLRSTYYNEYAAPGGAAETLASAMALADSDTPAGVASLHLWRARPARPFGDREVMILSTLRPAFKASVEIWLRFGAHQSELLRTIDALDQAVVVCNAAGRVAHATPEATRILAADPDQALVKTAVAQLAAEVRAMQFGAGTPTARKLVRTRLACYRMSACSYAAAGATTPMILVSLTLQPRWERSDDELRAAFGLSVAEVRIARLLAQGHRNATIADMLCISEHTVKRHTEGVLRKLGVSSRAQVGPRIAG